jgi:hypothetical protein
MYIDKLNFILVAKRTIGFAHWPVCLLANEQWAPVNTGQRVNRIFASGTGLYSAKISSDFCNDVSL